MFDTHIHVHRLEAAEHYVEPCLVPAINEEDWSQMLQLRKTHPHLWLAMGVHPQHVDGWNEKTSEYLSALLENPAVIAVGEIGLDKRVAVPFELQERVLRCQLRLAVACGKPVVLHAVRSYDRLLPLLEEEQIARVGGVVHGFYGSVEVALQLEQLNLAIGVGRLILDPAAKKLPEVVQAVAQHSLLVETDAPWREAQDDWCRCWQEIADQVARLRGWHRALAVRVTDENARRIFRLPQERNVE